MSYFIFFCCLLICKPYWISYLGWGRESFCLLLFTCNYVVSVRRGFLWVPGMGYVILLKHSLSLPYFHFRVTNNISKHFKKSN